MVSFCKALEKRHASTCLSHIKESQHMCWSWIFEHHGSGNVWVGWSKCLVTSGFDAWRCARWHLCIDHITPHRPNSCALALSCWPCTLQVRWPIPCMICLARLWSSHDRPHYSRFMSISHSSIYWWSNQQPCISVMMLTYPVMLHIGRACEPWISFIRW